MLADPDEAVAVVNAAKLARRGLPELDRLAFDARLAWLAEAHPHQIEPEGDWWRIWLLLAGRGAGKTRCAAEWAWWEAWRDPGSRTLLTAPTAGDIRDTCLEGDSGLLNVIPPALVQNYNRSLNEVILKNGSLLKGIPASEPERFRGGQWHRVWADELAAWVNDEDAMSMIMFALRLGTNPRFVATTTPRPKPLIRSLVARDGKDVTVTRASTMTNLNNLAPTFRDQIMSMEGTKLFRQEALGELIDPEEAGIVQRSWINLWPANKPLPQFERIIMSLDTAFTEKTLDKKGDPDPTACGVWGIFFIKSVAHVLLLDCWEDHLSFPDLLKRVKREMNTRYGDDQDSAIIKPLFGSTKPMTSGRKPDMILIEDKGSGISLRQALAASRIEAYAYNPGRADKLSRLHIVSPIFAQRRVWVPESDRFPGKPRTWCDSLITQLCSFAGEGSIKHDDHVDQSTQALRVCMDTGLLNLVKPTREDREQKARDEAERASPTPVVNPYAA